jgi:hypothetical protein
MQFKRSQTRSLEDCLMADAGLARLSSHAKRLLGLQRVFESATPLSRQARVANLKLGKIVIHASNSAVAAKLRQIEPRLAAIFRSEAAEVTGIDIRVQPDASKRQPARLNHHVNIGSRQKQALTSLADSLPEGSALRNALARLVERS